MTSGMWIVRRSSAARAAALWRPGRIGFFSMNIVSSADALNAHRHPEHLPVEAEYRMPCRPRTDAPRIPRRSRNTGSRSNAGAADDLENVGGRGLLLQRFGQLARALLLGVEQARVLDRDHRLVGESCDQLDVLIGERPHYVPAQNDHADRTSLAQEGHAKEGAIATQPL